MSSTESTAALYALIRERLLGFQPRSGAMLSTVLDDLWIVQAPDDAAFPYGTLRFINTNADGATNGDRQTMDAELMLYAQPRSRLSALEGYADVADQAMLRWQAYLPRVGILPVSLVFTRERSRYSLPPAPPPADREICGIRCVYPLVVWPSYLTQYAVES